MKEENNNIKKGIFIELEHLYNLVGKIPKKYRKQFTIGVSNRVPVVMGYRKINNNLIKFMKKNDNYSHLVAHLWNFSDFIINNLNKFNKGKYVKLGKIEK